jgi:hypothetical protein
MGGLLMFRQIIMGGLLMFLLMLDVACLLMLPINVIKLLWVAY